MAMEDRMPAFQAAGTDVGPERARSEEKGVMMGLRQMAACTTAYFMAKNCKGCPIQEMSMQHFLFGVESYPVFGTVSGEKDLETKCLIDETAAICMYTGANLPWYYRLKVHHILVEDECWKELVERELGRYGQDTLRTEAFEQQSGTDRDAVGDECGGEEMSRSF